MARFYVDPSRADDKWSLPDGEAFYQNAGDHETDDGEPCEAGWYYWICFPGCMPEGDGAPCGPFSSEQAAILNCRETFGD